MNSCYSSISLFQVLTISLQLLTYIPSDHILALKPEQGFCSVDYLSWSLWVFRRAGFFPTQALCLTLSPSQLISSAHFAFLFPVYHFSMYFIHCLGLISDWQAYPGCPVYHLEIQLELLHSSILLELPLFSQIYWKSILMLKQKPHPTLLRLLNINYLCLFILKSVAFVTAAYCPLLLL